MISIVLTVLKVIGWLLLILLLLLLTVIFVLLFVSVKYRIAFENEEHLQLRLTTRWLFPLFYLKGSYQTGETEEENPQFQMYLLGFRIAPKKKKAKEEVKPDCDDSTDDASEISEPQLVAMEMSPTEKSDERENVAESAPESDIKTESESGCDPTNDEPCHSNEKKKAHTTKEKGSQKQKSDLFLSLREKYTSMKSMINDEGNRRAVRLLLSEVRYLLKHYGPRAMRGHLEYATGDPANTGLVTGALSLCPFVYGKKMEVIPDFESETFYIRGNACLIGHIRLVHLLKSIIVLFFDKDIRRIAHQLKK